MIRALVTGAHGQVGADAVELLAGRAEVIACDRAALDLSDPAAIRERVRAARPALIVNAGAYTAVDRAETEPGLAHAVNAVAPEVLAAEAKRAGALLVHYSTDYVFDGAKPGPYGEDDPTAPLGTYGRTKLEGERAVAASGCDHLVLRTSWVYAPRGRNFLLTMLRLAGEREELRVVDDQHGAPTASRELARATLAILSGGDAARALDPEGLARAAAKGGVCHATAAGETTWFAFAQAIFEAWAKRIGPSFKPPRVVPIATRDYPTPARRPANSVLSNARLHAAFGVSLADWRAGLAETIAALPR